MYEEFLFSRRCQDRNATATKERHMDSYVQKEQLKFFLEHKKELK